MAELSAKKEGTDLTWLWALAAVVAIVALMGWLFLNRPEETAVVAPAEDTAEVADPAATAADAELATVAAAPADYIGTDVRIANVPVTAVLGSRVFWADVPGGSPFLIVIGPMVSDVSWVTEGTTATLVGSIREVTEADLDQLVQAQALLPEGKSQAMIATHYLQVTNVER